MLEPVTGSRVPDHHRKAYRVREFSRRLWDKAVEDDVFFMAGAIAFSVIVALVPLLILGIGVAGYVLSARFGDPTEAVMRLVAEGLPASGNEVGISELIRGPVSALVDGRYGFTLAGALFFIWLATRLVGTLRIALREVFDVGQTRGLLAGKAFDVGMVVVGVLLLTLNLGTTVALETAMDRGVEMVGLQGPAVGLANRLLGHGVALVSIMALFLLAYRYLPARRIPWRTAWIAAWFAAVCHEVLKSAFSWYVTEVANYGSAFGNMATLVVLIFWIYYGALVFILGGEVAQVSVMRKASRVTVRASFERSA